MQQGRLFQPQPNNKGQCKKGDKAKGKNPLYDMRPCAGNAVAGPCAAAVVAAIRAHQNADCYAAYDPNESCSMCVILVRGCGSLSSFTESISANPVGRDYTVPGYAVGFFMLNKNSLEKAMQSCCTIPIPGISAASCGDAARESLAGALFIALARV